MTPDLPTDLKASLVRMAEGLSRNDAAQQADAISRTYRSGGGSGLIKTRDAALAYALARMPATYAAVAASLNALSEARPDFAPASLLDVGAGPGTATWAATEAFETLRDLTLLDSNSALRSLAIELADTSARLAALDYELGDARKLLATAPASDLVIASYVINELGDAERAALTEAAWAKTRDTLLIIEPGTPAGYARIIETRARLIADGAHVIAPCPHDNACPLATPDWCHFTQRLSRSRAHKHLKGAELPYEDEKFSYVALSRSTNPQGAARVLAQPLVTKIAVTARLCTPHGVELASVPHRDKKSYMRAKKWNWGGVVFPNPAAMPE